MEFAESMDTPYDLLSVMIVYIEGYWFVWTICEFSMIYDPFDGPRRSCNLRQSASHWGPQPVPPAGADSGPVSAMQRRGVTSPTTDLAEPFLRDER